MATTPTRMTRRQFHGALGALGVAWFAPRALFARERGRSDAPDPGVSASARTRVIAGQVGEILKRHLASGYLSGAVALVGRGETAEVVTIGNQSLEGVRSMRRDSSFRIASMTKPITAAATMILIDHGRLRLQDPVDRWLPELANRRVLRQLGSSLDDTVHAHRRITVGDLLTSRSGLGVILAPPDSYPIQRRISELGLVGFGPPDPTSPIHADEWLRRLGTLPLLAEPGEQWLYNTSSCILGVLLTRVLGRSLPEVFQKLVFEPLGMKDSGFFVPADKRDRLVSAYRPEAGRIELFDAPPSSAWLKPPIFPDGAAGLVSTADDYFAFSHMLMSHGSVGEGRLLSEASAIGMTSNHLTDAQRAAGAAILGEERGWGFGLSVVVARTSGGLPNGSYGWNGGLGTSWLADPRSGLSAILLTQTAFATPSPPHVHEEFWRAVFAPTVL